MLLVKTQIKISPIAGIGLFADELIKKDTVIWKFEPKIDLLLEEHELASLELPSTHHLNKYLFLDKIHGKYMLCGDDARFFNHAENCNCFDGFPNITIAIRDILIGEELTVNYHDFCLDIQHHIG